MGKTMLLHIDLWDYPLLRDYVRGGHIKLEKKELVGLASDGTEVILGDQSSLHMTEEYLRACPTPYHW